MIIHRYGIELFRLQEEQIEMVREWRNDDKIRKFMFFQELITSDQQRSWFDRIDNDRNFYFIIRVDSKPVGLINTSKIDYEKEEADSGLFIYEDAYLGSHVPVLASMAMLDVFFPFFNLKRITAKVRVSNQAAMDYNYKLGFRSFTESDTLFLEKGMYYSYAEGLRNAAKNLHGAETIIDLTQHIYRGSQQILDRLSDLDGQQIRALDLKLIKADRAI